MNIERYRDIFLIYDHLKDEAARMPVDEFTRYAFARYGAPGMGEPLLAMVQLLTGRCADAEQKSIQNGV